ncbi:MAG: ATP-binding cassette domain-containing protein [Spirochaetes bacterium]|nr:ATP-binding cassette domain-containing protein [Spirochaetota bacterium]
MKEAPLSLDGFSISLARRSLIGESDFSPPAGSSTVIVGPTGVGKSVLLRAIAGLLPLRTFTLGGSMRLHGLTAYRNGRKTRHRTWVRIMARGLVFVPAESAQAMNPSLTLEHNRKLLAPEARETIERRLKTYFGLDFGAFARLYPDEVSGGELQRITLMILLSRRGDLVLLDEPTVNLDRNLRKRFIDFLNDEILSTADKTVVMASHDLDFIQSLKLDDAYALEAGRLVHLDAVPRAVGFAKPESRKSGGTGLSLADVSQSYFKRGIFGERTFQAFTGLSIQFDRSTIYGITGPSGCGKSSMIKAILRLIDGTTGSIRLDGQDLVSLKRRERGGDPPAFVPFRRKMAVVQQDSRFAFFPDLRIRDSIRQIEISQGGPGSFDHKGFAESLAKVGLKSSHVDAYPRSLSSGEMKRMDIARALAAKPEVLLLDEPFAHIDFDTRARVMQAISDYMAENATILIVVTHEDFDLRYFIERNYDFPALVG